MSTKKDLTRFARKLLIFHSIYKIEGLNLINIVEEIMSEFERLILFTTGLEWDHQFSVAIRWWAFQWDFHNQYRTV
jgi:hypothetical protein